MKYIDAELLQKEIERQIMGIIKKQDANPDIPKHRWYLYEGMKEAFNDIGDFIDSLQQEQQEKKEVKFVFPKFLYARTTNNKTIDVSYAPQSLDAIEYIRSDSLQQEQPEMNIEKEIEDYWKAHGPMSHAEFDRLAKCARHFYQLALKSK